MKPVKLLFLILLSIFSATGCQPNLHRAAFKGKIARVQSLIIQGTDVNAKDSRGMTPLHYACCGGHKEIAEFLIEKGADVNVKGFCDVTPLHYAANRAVAELLLASGANINAKAVGVNQTPLHRAVFRGNKDVVELLIAKGVDVNVRTADGWTPLHSAAKAGNMDVAELLIAKGADVNVRTADGRTPLHSAAMYGNMDVAKVLITRGADINAKNKWGETPLHVAAAKGWGAGATPCRSVLGRRMKVEWWPPWGCHEYVGVAHLLIAAGADVNPKNQWGETPLHRAAALGQKHLVELLIAAGADVNAKRKGGKVAPSPLDDAKWYRDKEIVELLRKHGAKE